MEPIKEFLILVKNMDLMLDDFITDVSLPDQDDLISSSAKELVSKIDF